MAFRLPIDHFAFPLACYHVQERLPQVVPDAPVTDHLVPEDDEPEIIDVFHVVLLDVNPVLWDGTAATKEKRCQAPDRRSCAARTVRTTHHVHQDVSDHHHGRLVVVPGLV